MKNTHHYCCIKPNANFSEESGEDPPLFPYSFPQEMFILPVYRSFKMFPGAYILLGSTITKYINLRIPKTEIKRENYSPK